MKKLIITLTLIITTNLHLHSMQSCLSAQSEPSNEKSSVRITGTSDGIDLVLPEQYACKSEVFNAFLRADKITTDLGCDSCTQTSEKVFSLAIAPFNSFKSSDIIRMCRHLSLITNKTDIRSICYSESTKTNIKQLLLADFLDIEILKDSEIDALIHKFKNSKRLLSSFKNKPRLSELIQFIPCYIQEEVIKRSRLIAPIYSALFTSTEPINLVPQQNKGKKEEISQFDFIITLANNDTLHICNACTGQLLQTLEGHACHVKSASFDGNVKQISTTSWNDNLQIWNINSGKQLYKIPMSCSRFEKIAKFSPDGNRILVISNNEFAQILDSNSGQLLQKIEPRDPMNMVIYASFSSNGNHIIAVCRSMATEMIAAQIFDADTGQFLKTNILQTDLSSIEIQGISTDGNLIAATCEGAALIFNTNDGQLLHSIENSNEMIYKATFSRDGNHLLTISDSYNLDVQDRLIRTISNAQIWDICTGQLLHKTDRVDNAEFSSGANHIIMRDWNGILFVCHLHSVDSNNNPYSLNQELLMRLILSYMNNDQILDLNVPENSHLKSIFDTLDKNDATWNTMIENNCKIE